MQLHPAQLRFAYVFSVLIGLFALRQLHLAPANGHFIGQMYIMDPTLEGTFDHFDQCRFALSLPLADLTICRAQLQLKLFHAVTCNVACQLASSASAARRGVHNARPLRSYRYEP